MCNLSVQNVCEMRSVESYPAPHPGSVPWVTSGRGASRDSFDFDMLWISQKPLVLRESGHIPLLVCTHSIDKHSPGGPADGVSSHLTSSCEMIRRHFRWRIYCFLRFPRWRFAFWSTSFHVRCRLLGAEDGYVDCLHSTESSLTYLPTPPPMTTDDRDPLLLTDSITSMPSTVM